MQVIRHQPPGDRKGRNASLFTSNSDWSNLIQAMTRLRWNVKGELGGTGNHPNWHPDGVTTIRVSNFADGRCLHLMSLVYDSCNEMMDEEEKQMILEAITYRMKRNLAGGMNDIEGRVSCAHNWQHLVAQSIDAAFATLWDVPETATWLEYLYELWLARLRLIIVIKRGWVSSQPLL